MRLTKKLLCQQAGTFDLDTVFTVGLSNLSLRGLDAVINECVHLKSVNLSRNQLSGLGGLDGGCLLELDTLNVSQNVLTSLSECAKLNALKKLYLHGNRIESASEVKALAAKLPSLEVLYLKQLDGSEANPVCATIPNYRRQLQQWFPQLLVLDGERLQQSTGSVYELADALNKSEAWDAGASELADVDLKVHAARLQARAARIGRADQAKVTNQKGGKFLISAEEENFKRTIIQTVTPTASTHTHTHTQRER
jgi:hypothetical protein